MRDDENPAAPPIVGSELERMGGGRGEKKPASRGVSLGEDELMMMMVNDGEKKGREGEGTGGIFPWMPGATCSGDLVVMEEQLRPRGG